jgi:hypothetical protein
MKKFSKEDLIRLAEKVRAQNTPRWVQEIEDSAKKYGAGFTGDATIDELPAIEKESQEGLRIGKYGNLPSPEGETPTFAVATGTKVSSYTGFRFTEAPSLFESHRPKQSTLLDWEWATVPWYARLLGLLRLPYDLLKFIVTGRLIVIPWPWRW